MRIEDIWPKYRARLKAFLHSRVSNAADVDDLLQDISIKVMAGLPALKDLAKLQSWLFQTADRTIIDHYRKNGRAQAHPDDLWYHRDDPETRQDLEGCVEPFIRGLPSETAEMLLAIDIQGMSQQDYADHLGLPYSTLKSRVQKGRAKLRRAFEDCCNISMDARGNISDVQEKPQACKKC
ncbi:MAG: RNA polymerase sigma factor SigZ [Ruegeria sp.]